MRLTVAVDEVAAAEAEDAAVAPVAARRLARSACVVHVIDVPAELVKGKAAQLKSIR